MKIGFESAHLTLFTLKLELAKLQLLYDLGLSLLEVFHCYLCSLVLGLFANSELNDIFFELVPVLYELVKLFFECLLGKF